MEKECRHLVNLPREALILHDMIIHTSRDRSAGLRILIDLYYEFDTENANDKDAWEFALLVDVPQIPEGLGPVKLSGYQHEFNRVYTFSLPGTTHVFHLYRR